MIRSSRAHANSRRSTDATVLLVLPDAGLPSCRVRPRTDALAKMRGLAAYAGRHGDEFARIESVIQDPEGTLLAVNWKSESARAVDGDASGDVLEFFREHGGRYS
jgi:hypothetical protein